MGRSCALGGGKRGCRGAAGPPLGSRGADGVNRLVHWVAGGRQWCIVVTRRLDPRTPAASAGRPAELCARRSEPRVPAPCSARLLGGLPAAGMKGRGCWETASVRSFCSSGCLNKFKKG